MMKTALPVCGLLLVLVIDHPTVSAQSEPLRVADVIGGHVHPSLCVAPNGDLLAVYNKEGGGGKELLLCRSTDGGHSWSTPTAIPVIKDCSIYPGSLTSLSDGRVVLHWSCYHRDGPKLWRTPQFCLSADSGRTWSAPKSLPVDDLTNYSCLRHSVTELADGTWICPLYDRTVIYDPEAHSIRSFGDGRNHGMVPIVRTTKGTLISGAPQADSRVPVGVPGGMVEGLRSSDSGSTWDALHAFPYFGVAGYDLVVLDNGWIVLTSIIYGVGEWSYELIVSRDDGRTWSVGKGVEVYNPGRRISGRGWPRTVQINRQTLGTLFYDLDANQPGGPGLFFVRTPIAALPR